MAKLAPTLADAIYRHAFRNETNHGWRSNPPIRDLMHRATRFVLDDGMSAMLGQLANEAFVQKKFADPVVSDDGQEIRGFNIKGDENDRATAQRLMRTLADQIRASARLPHAVTWIEYSLQAYRKHVNAAYPEVVLTRGPGGIDKDAEDVPDREGWLLVQHPGIETCFLAHIFLEAPTSPPALERNFTHFTLPWAIGWSAEEDALPWDLIWRNTGSSVAAGIATYESLRCGFVKSPYLIDLDTNPDWKESSLALAREWTGAIRRIWALLATINDLPIAIRQVVAAKGFIGKGQYRKFLDHKTITLTVPAKEYRTVARKALALARRRAHNVRGHWRKDWRHPGERLWIKEHQRGDATLGFVTHSYVVEKGTE